MSDLLPFFVLCLTSFFSLTNPLGTMPLFLTMTHEMDEDERKQIAKRATFVAFVILVGFTILGQVIFKIFGLSSNGFRIAGGIIIFNIGYNMLQARYSSAKVDPGGVQSVVNDISITPLAIPMICGPGAIAQGIVLMEEANSIEKKIALLIAMLVVFFLIYVILRASSKLNKVLGETGINVMMRLMGLILMVIAVEIFVVGAHPLLIEILHSGFEDVKLWGGQLDTKCWRVNLSLADRFIFCFSQKIRLCYVWTYDFWIIIHLIIAFEKPNNNRLKLLKLY